MAKKPRIRDKIAPYIEQGLSPAQIAKLTGYNYQTVYRAVKTEKENRKVQEPIKRPKGWNADRRACKKCMFRGDRNRQVNGCDYIILASHSRGCRAEDCDKYVKGARLKHNVHAHKNGFGEY